MENKIAGVFLNMNLALHWSKMLFSLDRDKGTDLQV